LVLNAITRVKFCVPIPEAYTESVVFTVLNEKVLAPSIV